MEDASTFEESRQQNIVTEKDRALLLPSSKNFFLDKTSIRRMMYATSYTPQLVFLIFVHRLHVDNISVLVTHHTTHRRVRHSGDYLVDNPSFLLETFQG